jgi:hypothetical protein
MFFPKMHAHAGASSTIEARAFPSQKLGNIGLDRVLAFVSNASHNVLNKIPQQ